MGKNKTIPLVQIKEKLDEISPSFCAAKWKQVTMHLHNGHTHSCHHPTTHKVPIEEIALNPTALHNTIYKKQQRKLMLEGQRPEECDYCWRVEDKNNDTIYSDRFYKSAADWAYKHIDHIKDKNWNYDVDPSYVEVNFGNTCNFKCSYCSPNVSSQWMDEIVRHGAYPTSGKFNSLEHVKFNDQMPISNKDINPYVDAFWKWWPKLYNKMEIFRITGGEPLLNKNTFKVLNYIIENPNSNLELGINTNLNPPAEVFDRFLEKIKIIINEGKVKNVKIYTSAEAHGKQAEYIRFGMNYEQWLDNIHRMYREIPNIEFTIMSTYNFLSIFSYQKFLKDILDIKRTYGSYDKSTPMFLDVPYLRYPSHQAIFMIEPEMLGMIYDQITFAYQNLEYANWYGTAHRGFYEGEVDKFRRIYDVTKDLQCTENILKDRKDFILFVDEHDKRRGTNFLQTFPEMEQIYYNWKKI